MFLPKLNPEGSKWLDTVYDILNYQHTRSFYGNLHTEKLTYVAGF